MQDVRDVERRMAADAAQEGRFSEGWCSACAHYSEVLRGVLEGDSDGPSAPGDASLAEELEALEVIWREAAADHCGVGNVEDEYYAQAMATAARELRAVLNCHKTSPQSPIQEPSESEPEQGESGYRPDYPPLFCYVRYRDTLSSLRKTEWFAVAQDAQKRALELTNQGFSPVEVGRVATPTQEQSDE